MDVNTINLLCDICVCTLMPFSQLKPASSNSSTLSRSATFDIPVDLLLRVQVLEALEDLSQDRSDLGLVQSSGLHLQKGKQTQTRSKLRMTAEH